MADLSEAGRARPRELVDQTVPADHHVGDRGMTPQPDPWRCRRCSGRSPDRVRPVHRLQGRLGLDGYALMQAVVQVAGQGVAPPPSSPRRVSHIGDDHRCRRRPADAGPAGRRDLRPADETAAALRGTGQSCRPRPSATPTCRAGRMPAPPGRYRSELGDAVGRSVRIRQGDSSVISFCSSSRSSACWALLLVVVARWCPTRCFSRHSSGPE